jgi:hypothetical protein
VAALIARLALIAELARRLPAAVVAAAALITRLAFIAELARRLIGKGRARNGQREQAGK